MIKQRGMTLPELMVALVIGVFILAGTLSVFSMSSNSVNATGQHNQLQESARIAVRMLQDDIAQAGFFADLTGMSLASVASTSHSLAAGDDCIGLGANNASYPQNNLGHFRTIWAENVTTSANPSFDCITSNVDDSDVLQLKRLDNDPLNDAGDPVPAADLDNDQIYFAVNVNQGQFFKGSDGDPGLTNSRIYRYRHRIYYIRNSAGGIPSLYMHDLGAAGMSSPSPLVEGVEAIEYEFGVDVDGDSVVDTYLATPDVTNAIWDQSGLSRIVSVRLHLLLVSVSTDDSFVAQSIAYDMPSGARTFSNDKLRRKKVSTTIMLRNPIMVNQRNGI